MKCELFRNITKRSRARAARAAVWGAALALLAAAPARGGITRQVIDTQLPTNSAALPAMARDADGRLTLVYPAVRAVDSEQELRCVVRETDGQMRSNVVSVWERGYLAGVACVGTQAHVAASRPAGTGAGYYRTAPVTVYIVVSNVVTHGLSNAVFGSLLERPSWDGEIGIEAGVQPGTNYLQPLLQAKLRDMAPAVLRFPGGTDVDYMDWTDMINLAGRTPPRPVSTGHTGGVVSNRFGYDECYALCTNMGSEMLLCVNLRSAIEASSYMAFAQTAAMLIAYCNMPADAASPPYPAYLTNWPRIRAQNGNAQPFGVKYVQLGNETWFYKGSDAGFCARVRAYIDELRAADTNIKVVVDAYSGSTFWSWWNSYGLDTRVDYLSQHNYIPWEITNAKLWKRGQAWTMDKLTAEDVWYAWVAVPRLNAAGESVLTGRALTEGRARGYRAAVTEWNWNGWWGASGAPLDSYWARGLGAAGILHGLMRAGDVVALACQSMTVGKTWGIAGIRVSETAGFAPFYAPCGQALKLYQSHHGGEVVAVQTRGVPTYEQVFSMGGPEGESVQMIAATNTVTLVDVVATRSAARLYVHAINRHYRKDIPVEMDVSLYSVGGTATAYLLTSGWVDGMDWDGPEIGTITPVTLSVSGGKARVTLPKRAVAIVEFERL
jgi:alpha-L-arabinofuranosidase